MSACERPSRIYDETGLVSSPHSSSSKRFRCEAVVRIKAQLVCACNLTTTVGALSAMSRTKSTHLDEKRATVAAARIRGGAWNVLLIVHGQRHCSALSSECKNSQYSNDAVRHGICGLRKTSSLKDHHYQMCCLVRCRTGAGLAARWQSGPCPSENALEACRG